MHYLDLTLPTPAENLALDEALLEEAEKSELPKEVIRLWEPTQPMVVVGRSSKIGVEVHGETCRREGIPVLRRTSGGLAVVTGPGCLMYALILSYRLRPELRIVDHAHRVVLETLVEALRPCQPEVCRQGISDLAIRQAGVLRKFSGNSVRMKRECLLYHGTILYDFPLAEISRLLAMPPRQPEYRNGRPHGAFVANLPLPAEKIRQALRSAWHATEPLIDWPKQRTAQLVEERYASQQWNEGRDGA